MTEADDDSFSEFTEQLAALNSRDVANLPTWQRHLLVFRRLTDQVVWEGMLGALANLWDGRLEVIETFGVLDLRQHARRIEAAIDVAQLRGLADAGGLNHEAILEAPEVSALFDAAEESLNREWNACWGAAEAYARRQGWRPARSS